MSEELGGGGGARGKKGDMQVGLGGGEGKELGLHLCIIVNTMC